MRLEVGLLVNIQTAHTVLLALIPRLEIQVMYKTSK